MLRPGRVFVAMLAAAAVSLVVLMQFVVPRGQAKGSASLGGGPSRGGAPTLDERSLRAADKVKRRQSFVAPHDEATSTDQTLDRSGLDVAHAAHGTAGRTRSASSLPSSWSSSLSSSSFSSSFSSSVSSSSSMGSSAATASPPSPASPPTASAPPPSTPTPTTTTTLPPLPVPRLLPWNKWAKPREAYCRNYRPREGWGKWPRERFFDGQRGKLRSLPRPLLDHYLSAAESRVLYTMLRDVTAVFHKHCVPYWMHSATLLGAVRHGGLIPWDEDLDLAIFAQDMDAFLKRLRPDLRRLGYDVMLFESLERHGSQNYQLYKLGHVGDLNRGCKGSGRGLKVVAPWPFLDLWPMRYSPEYSVGGGGDSVMTHQSKGVEHMFNLELFPMKHVFPLRSMRFGNLSVLAPNMPVAYLNDCRSYKDWRRKGMTASDSVRHRGVKRNVVQQYVVDFTDPKMAPATLPALPFGPLAPLPPAVIPSTLRYAHVCPIRVARERHEDLGAWTGDEERHVAFASPSLNFMRNRIHVLHEDEPSFYGRIT